MTNTGSAQNCQAKGNQAKPNATWENIKVATPEQPMKSVFHLGWQRSSCLLPAFPKPEETLSFHPQTLRHISVISPVFVSPYRKCYHGFFLSFLGLLPSKTCISILEGVGKLCCPSHPTEPNWYAYPGEHVPQHPPGWCMCSPPPNHPKEVRSLFHKGSVGTSRGKGHGSVDTSLWSVLTA